METLKSMPYAQAHIIRRPNCITLVSYKTEVAEIKGGILTVHGLYSMTTRKHIGAFMKEFGLDYSIAKHCYTHKVGFDIIAKEYVALA
jgi:hypothetical protein